MDTEQQRGLANRCVAMSSALHVALFLLLGVGNFFAPKPLVMLPTIQVDIVALPSQVKNNDAPAPDLSLPVKPNAPVPAPAEPRSEPDVMTKPEPKGASNAEEEFALERKKEADAKKRAEAALKRMREQLKQERIAQEQKKQTALEKRRADLKAFEQKYRQAINGNQRNEGNALTGQMKATLNAYVGAITDRIRENWALPSFLQDQRLTAWIVIHVDARGNVVAMEFTRVSGNTLFDNNAESAIRRASPLPPPPAEMAAGLRRSGIEVKFPL